MRSRTQKRRVFEAVKAELKFAGGRDLLDRVKTINDFRNTRVAHQEQPLTNPAEAKTALVVWVDGLNRLWQAGRRPSAAPAAVFKEHDVVRAITNIENEGEKIAKGTEGTVVSVYRNGEAYAVEFVAGQSSMVVVTVYAKQLEAAKP